MAPGGQHSKLGTMRIEDSSPTGRLWRPAFFAAALSLVTGCLLSIPGLDAQSLLVSSNSMDLQNRQASRHGYSFARNTEDVLDMIDSGALVPVVGNEFFEIKEGVTFPYARPEVREFIEHLGRQYYDHCGEKLVVTSLTRARNRQPRNASKRSVHPTGMALDLRRSWDRSCRTWIEMSLLTLEVNGVLDAMLESRPPHYHVAVFPREWRHRGTEILDQGEPTHYQVSRGDTLWKIARRHNTDVYSVKKINGLRSDSIFIGQILQLPASR